MPNPRPHIPTLSPVVHGSVSDAELAAHDLQREDVLDFSASLNPLGPSPRVLDALRSVDISRYPEDGAPALRKALARHAGVDVKNVLVGNGSSELLWLLAQAYLHARQLTLIVSPTYGEYARAFQAVGARVERLSTGERADFAFDPDSLSKLIAERQPIITAIGNPNNPTGQFLSNAAIRSLALTRNGGMLLVDEAYRPFVPGAPESSDNIHGLPVVLLRSLTKIHGLAGLRLGYLIARAEVIEALDRIRPPWSVNAMAQAAGLAALTDVDHVRRSQRAAQLSRQYLVNGFAALGLPTIAGPVNFLLVRVGDGASVRTALLAQGMIVRDCASFGLPAYIRIGVRRQEECEQLMNVIADLPEICADVQAVEG